METSFGRECVCEICGKEFISNFPERKVCSAECGLKVIMSGDIDNETITKKACIHCGTSYMPYTTKQKFCVKKCRAEYNRQRKTNKDKFCPVCNKEFHNLSACNAQRYCSKKCRNIRRNIRRRNKEI